MRLSSKIHTFIPEPERPLAKYKNSTTKYERIAFFDDDQAKLARRRLNKWLNDWNFPDRKELVGRLKANDDRHFDGVVWELYLNSFLKQSGFIVKRIRHTPGQSSPDFLVRRFGQSFYLEATSISEAAIKPSDSHWKQLLDYLEQIENSDFYFSIHPEKITNEPPQMKKIKREILDYLESLDYVELSKLSYLEIPEQFISIKGWEIRVKAIPRSSREYDGVSIAMHGTSGSGFITDLHDLRDKIEDKRLKYKNLEHPLVLAILENAFFGSDDKWHRIGALFGQQALLLGANGEAKDIRKNDGTWDIHLGESKVSALILQSRLNIILPKFDKGEIWLNPNGSQNEVLKHLPLDTYWLQGNEIAKRVERSSWNAIDDPNLRSKLTRFLTKLAYRKD